MPPPPCIAFLAVLYCKCNKKTSYGASAPLTGVERQSGANPELSRNSKGGASRAWRKPPTGPKTGLGRGARMQ